jgi:hypothetical protein
MGPGRGGWPLALGGGEHQAGHDEQAGNQPHQSGHLDMSHRTLLAQTMSKRSVWTRSPSTPRSPNAVSTASIIGSGPQMKNWKRR